MNNFKYVSLIRQSSNDIGRGSRGRNLNLLFVSRHYTTTYIIDKQLQTTSETI